MRQRQWLLEVHTIYGGCVFRDHANFETIKRYLRYARQDEQGAAHLRIFVPAGLATDGQIAELRAMGAAAT